jgi:hypothetical protein
LICRGHTGLVQQQVAPEKLSDQVERLLRLSWAGAVRSDRYIGIGKVRVLEVVAVDQLDVVRGRTARGAHILLYLRAHRRHGQGAGRVDQGVTERS